MRGVAIALAVMLGLAHTFAAISALGRGAWDFAVRWGFMLSAPSTYSGELAMDRAWEVSGLVPLLELGGGGVRAVGALAVLFGVTLGVGMGRPLLARASAVAGLVAHGVHALTAAVALFLAWPYDDMVFLAYWVGEWGLYSFESWVGLRIWAALAFSAAMVVVDLVITGVVLGASGTPADA